MKHIIAFARITFIDSIRRPGYWIGGLCFLALSGLSAVPFAPGIPADAAHYMEAGVATLMVGGIFLSLMIAPHLLAPGRGGALPETLLSLPTGPAAFVTGLFIGFGGALLLFFSLGGILLLIVGEITTSDPSYPNPLLSVGWSFLVTLLSASLILGLSRFLGYVPALTAALFVLIMGQLSVFLPFPLFLLFPALSAMNPVTLSFGGLPTAALALVQISAFIGLYLYLAVWGMRVRLS